MATPKDSPRSSTVRRVSAGQSAGLVVRKRVRGNHMIVDRLFAAAELRLGGDN